MNIITQLFKWISESLIYPFSITNFPEHADIDIEPKKKPDTYTKWIKGELISNYPKFNEIVHLETPHLGLGNYALFFDAEVVMIEIEMQRISESYVLVKICEREVLWDIRDDTIYTDDSQDTRYWSKDMYLQVKNCNEFIMRPNEIIGFVD